MNHPAKHIAWPLGLLVGFIGLIGLVVDRTMNVEGTLIVLTPNTLHNLFHIGAGIVALYAVSESDAFARWFLIIFGVVYGLLAVDGMAWNGQLLGLFTMTRPEAFFHMFLAAFGLVGGLWDLEKTAVTGKKAWR